MNKWVTFFALVMFNIASDAFADYVGHHMWLIGAVTGALNMVAWQHVED